ncbi:hypothetical protein HYALB_00011699 [Hymenoscyphus albidus]|uniref:Uncharacterized protein n=1 Tax=Hymenoscyphus albidus TaxID=595503 RepID=A0A9N9LP54_9HELO|nr:hypothetical protein HYALB_00011699 [Hymenoscyphus albidus]
MRAWALMEFLRSVVTGFKEWSKVTDRPWAKPNREKYFYKVENVNVREWHKKLGGNPNGRN